MGQSIFSFSVMARIDVICLGSVKRFGLITCDSLFYSGNPVLNTERVYKKEMSECE